MSKQIIFLDVMKSITEAMDEQDGEVIARIHNEICCKKIRYVEDSIWEYTGEDDSVCG